MRDPGEGQLLPLAIPGSLLCSQKDLVYPIAKGLLTVQSHPVELNITACNYFWLVELKNLAGGGGGGSVFARQKDIPRARIPALGEVTPSDSSRCRAGPARCSLKTRLF